MQQSLREYVARLTGADPDTVLAVATDPSKPTDDMPWAEAVRHGFATAATHDVPPATDDPFDDLGGDW